MPKSLKYYKKSVKRRTKKRKTIRKKGGNNDKVLCCMCEKKVDIKDTFIPRECLNKHYNAAHRICSDCWWDEKNGFAKENVSHKCPGCIKNLPLTYVKKESPIFIDLTEDN
jgi:hypothetical protein